MRSMLIALLPAIAMWSCSADIAFDPVIPGKLDAQISQWSSQPPRTDMLAMVGDHPAFSDEQTRERDFIFLHTPLAPRWIKCFVSDSIQFPDSLAFYHLVPMDSISDPASLLQCVGIKAVKHPRFIRVLVGTDSSLFLSPALRTGRNYQHTESIPSLDVIGSPTGTTDFRWRGFNVALTVDHVVTLEDQMGDQFCGVRVNTPKFIFYDLRNVDYNLNPTLYNPHLQLGYKYSIGIYSIDEEGFILNYRKFLFKADSLSLSY